MFNTQKSSVHRIYIKPGPESKLDFWLCKIYFRKRHFSMSLTKQFCTLEVYALINFTTNHKICRLNFFSLSNSTFTKQSLTKRANEFAVYFTQVTATNFSLKKTLKRATRTNMHIFIPTWITTATFKGTQVSRARACRDGSQSWRTWRFRGEGLQKAQHHHD